MKTLTIDTSDKISIAIVESGKTIAFKHIDDNKNHVELLSYEIFKLLGAEVPDEFSKISFVPSKVDGETHLFAVSPAEKFAKSPIDSVVVGTGPAPFTGLRVGLITAKMIAFAFGVPIFSVPTLAVEMEYATASLSRENVLVVNDAKRKQVFSISTLFDGTIVETPEKIVKIVNEKFLEKHRLNGGNGCGDRGGDKTSKLLIIGNTTELYKSEWEKIDPAVELSFSDTVFEKSVFGEIMVKNAKEGEVVPIYCSRPAIN
jgi:tRNA threonylcarbamoyl adenosine modification protein YeaZ